MFSKGFSKSFSFKLFRYFAIIILIITPIFTLAVISYQKTIMTADLVKEGKIISVLLASSLKPWIFAENRESLKDSLRDVMSHWNIDSVTIFNVKNGIVYKEHKKRAAVPDADAPPLDFADIRFIDGDGGQFYVSESKNSIDVLCPVKMESPGNPNESLYFDRPVDQKKEVTIGYIRVGISKDTISQETLRIVIRVAVAALLGILAGLSVLFIGAHVVTNPLKQLTEHVRRFGAGETVDRVPVASDDEIGRLAEAFNTMSDNLRMREEEKMVLQERLKQSEKLEAVGRLARGIAHDFNNILSTVQGSVYLIEKKFHNYEKLIYYVDQIQSSLARARGLIQSIILFSKAGRINRLPVELNSIIRRMGPILRSMTGNFITLDISLVEDDLVVLGDSVQIEQLIMNLAANATDAMSLGGILIIETRQMVIDDVHREEYHISRPGKYAIIHVADTGMGMDEVTKGKIFEPFFTTKETGKGTGLGLSIVYGIVEQHKGHIEVKSAQGHGTEFEVYLPLFEEDREPLGNI